MSASEINDNDELDLHIELSDQASKHTINGGSGSNVFVEIKESSSQFILNYSMSDTSQELGGVLLGNCIEKSGKYRVCVEVAIEARYTEASKGSVTFTHQTWDYINQIRDEKYPQYKIVGWFHTHPGFGIFLSGHDKFIHQNFFNLPWQIAYVVDPLAGKHGFFGWHNNNIAEIPFKAEVNPQPVQVPRTQLVERRVKTPVFGRIATATALIVLLFTNGYLYLSNAETNRQAEELELELSIMGKNLTSWQNEISHLQETNAALELKIDQMIQSEPFLFYTVTENDTLWGISERYLGDGNLYNVIAGFNNLQDPDLIQTGSKLIIPILEGNEIFDR